MGATDFLQYRPKYQIGEKVIYVIIQKSLDFYHTVQFGSGEITAHVVSDTDVKYIINGMGRIPLDECYIATDKQSLLEKLLKQYMEEIDVTNNRKTATGS